MNIQENSLIMSNGLPEAIIFDTDNTLYPYEPAHIAATRAVEAKVESTLGINKEIFSAKFKESRQETKNRLGSIASSHSRLLYLQRTIEKLGLGTRILIVLDLEQTYWRTFLINCKLFSGVLDFVQLLKSKGIATANITDLTAQIQFRKLVYFGLDEYFDYVVTSEEAGKDKPSREPFQLALEKLQVGEEKVWMIGDSAENDIYGAKKHFQMTTLQKIHKGVKVSNGQFAPDVSFNHYSELVKLLADL